MLDETGFYGVERGREFWYTTGELWGESVILESKKRKKKKWKNLLLKVEFRCMAR